MKNNLNLIRLRLFLVIGLLGLGFVIKSANIGYSAEVNDKEKGSKANYGIEYSIQAFNIADYFPSFNIADYFPLHQGDIWYYRVVEDGYESSGVIEIDGTEIINGVETVKRYEVGYNLDGSFIEMKYDCVAINSEGLMDYKEYELNPDYSIIDYNFLNPPYIYFPAQMRIGQEFTSYSLNTNYDYLNVFEEMAISGRTVELEGLENVQVPAGVFSGCLKIRFSEFRDESSDILDYLNPDVIKGWIWLAPGIGIVKSEIIEAEFNSETQLTETETTTTELTYYEVNP